MPSNANRRSYSLHSNVAAPPTFPTPAAGPVGDKHDHLLIWPEASGTGEAVSLFDTRPSLPWTGSRRLLLGVLQDALRAFFQTRLSTSTAGRRKFKEVQEWIWSAEQDWIYAFESICAHLRLDPNYIRQGLQRFLQPSRTLSATHRGRRMMLDVTISRRPFHLSAGPGTRIPSQKLRRLAQRRTVATIKA